MVPMNKLLFPLLLTGLFLFFSCEEEGPLGEFDYSTLDDGIAPDTKYFNNPPYPTGADTLRILAIGNSFTSDATAFLDALVKASGIDEGRICLYMVTEGGASFDTWIDNYRDEKPLNLQHVAGKVRMAVKGTLAQLLNQQWEVIVVQQVSNLSYVWSSYASLKQYVELITSSCPNSNVCLAFQLLWSHTVLEMPYVLQGNIACYKKMSQRYGIDVIIPTGTAIQLARDTRLNDKDNMTRDNWHLNQGVASYIASCTWFEALLRPVFGVPVVGNSAKPKSGYTEADILLGQQCAANAVLHPYYWW